MNKKYKVYIETSVISYLTARNSNNAIVAGNQRITRLWWNSDLSLFELLISNLVVREASLGDPIISKKRLNAIENFKNLDITKEVEKLADLLVSQGGVPENSIEDAFHISIASVHGVDFLLTWNFKHIANVVSKIKIEKIVTKAGYKLPILCSPLELMESQNE